MKPIVILVILSCLQTGCITSPPVRERTVIVHSVFFKLKHADGSDAERVFLVKAAELGKIPGVGNFQMLKETSPKNPYTLGLSMEFADQAAYDAYNNHPEHVGFVQQVWLKEVADFQEIDHVLYR
ncbi:MAG: Dabb family protein [Kiritimatiellales bacterium]|nr:Dabb family protein [Kiritimatiellales bacterium]